MCARMIILSRLLLKESVRNKIEARTIITKFSFRFIFLLKLYAKEKKGILNERNYRLLKIFDRKCRFLFSLFMVYFSVVSKWCWFFVYHFRAIKCPKLSLYFFQVVSQRFIEFRIDQNRARIFSIDYRA